MGRRGCGGEREEGREVGGRVRRERKRGRMGKGESEEGGECVHYGTM